MRRVLLIIGLIVLGGAAGFGIATLVSQRLSGTSSPLPSVVNAPSIPYYGNNGRPGGGMGRGMMGPNYGYSVPNSDIKRITIDQAAQAAKDAISNQSTDLEVAEVMQFQQNFYAVVVEKSSGRGAFEMLIDPYNGDVSYEPGPNMMWNLKYGMMGRTLTVTQDNTVTLNEAKDLAQKALDEEVPGATVEGNGYNFYGYYTFDYQVNSQIVGMLSVHGLDGQVWFHTWHGTFISEEELVNE